MGTWGNLTLGGKDSQHAVSSRCEDVRRVVATATEDDPRVVPYAFMEPAEITVFIRPVIFFLSFSL